MRTACWLATIGAAFIFLPVRPATADVIYFGLQNVSIPTAFNGVYLDIGTGATASMEFTGWEINPFFGGAGLGNSVSSSRRAPGLVTRIQSSRWAWESR